MPLEVPVLTGRWVRLEPLGEAHREALRPLAQDERVWEHTLACGLGAGFDPWFDEMLASAVAGRSYPFAVRRLAEGGVVGTTSFLDITPQHKRIEIGATWYAPSAWRTKVNPECKLLLLAHAFDVLGVNRVALVTDARNLRSQAAIAKLGAVREGVLRADRITQSGRVRDTVVFSVLRGEWPAVREGLLRRLAEGEG